jgi:hypothetical protein
MGLGGLVAGVLGEGACILDVTVVVVVVLLMWFELRCGVVRVW